MQTKGTLGMLIVVGIVLCLGERAEAQLAKQGTYMGHFG
jgi:hypothetical protein